MKTLPGFFHIQPEVARAIMENRPVVALESAVITHGLPNPVNLQLATDMENIIRENGATPATIAMIDGMIHIGLTAEEVLWLSNAKGTRKISRRDYGYAVASKLSGGTTVAGTMVAAHMAGIHVFATGGIGGVHRDAPFDVSADLLELGNTPMIVVCAGAKAILDLPATMEVLETNGVMVAGYKTNDLPAFYSTSSGIKLDCRMETPEQLARAAMTQWEMGISSALLVLQPVPEESAIPRADMEAIIDQAVQEAATKGIHGPAVTPFLLERVNQLSTGRSMVANLALLKNNALLAAQIAVAFHGQNAKII